MSFLRRLFPQNQGYLFPSYDIQEKLCEYRCIIRNASHSLDSHCLLWNSTTAMIPHHNILYWMEIYKDETKMEFSLKARPSSRWISVASYKSKRGEWIYWYRPDEDIGKWGEEFFHQFPSITKREMQKNRSSK